MKQKSEELILLLGTNLGDKEGNLKKAISLLMDAFGPVVQKSGLYKSEAWGFESENYFLNQVVVFQSSILPLEILKITQTIELEIGRIQKTKDAYADRIIDVDILFVGDQVIDNKVLTVPHPRVFERKFTILPLVELYSDRVFVLQTHKTKHLLEVCKDKSDVNLIIST